MLCLFFRPGGKQPLLQCVVYGGAGGGQVCHYPISTQFSPQQFTIVKLPQNLASPFSWLLRRNRHVFRGFPYGNWVVGYMAVSTKLLRMNILQRHHFTFRKIGRQLHAFLFPGPAFFSFKGMLLFSGHDVNNI